MFNLSQQKVLEKISSLTNEEKMVLLAGISLPAAEILQKLFPDDIFIATLIHLKKNPQFR